MDEEQAMVDHEHDPDEGDPSGEAVSDDDLTSLTPEQLDVDVLWQQLVAAKRDGDAGRVRAIENRMRQLQSDRRFAHLTNEELDERIRSLVGEREPKDMLGYSPGGGAGGDSLGTDDLMRFNRAIRDNQHAGIEATLSALLDERERRRD